MRRGVQSLIAIDWIGLKLEVEDSPNKFEIGLAGEVVDETQNTLKLKTEKGLKVVAKRGRTFKVWYMGHVVRVRGDIVALRPEEKIAKGLIMLKRKKGVKL
ncbi:MAG: ribonuclease P protein subunit [Archaeoglobaceae archaeon]